MFIAIGSAVGEAIRNHRARLPDKTVNVNGVYHHLKDCKLAVPTDKLRYVTHSRPNMQQAEAAFQGYTWYDEANTLAFELRSFRLLNKACLLRGTKEDAPCNGSDTSTATTGRGCARCTRWSSSSQRSVSWT